MVRNLDREIERHTQRHGRDVEDCEQRMLRQIAEDVPAEEAGVLRNQNLTQKMRRIVDGPRIGNCCLCDTLGARHLLGKARS